jgi:hypothetical protein
LRRIAVIIPGTVTNTWAPTAGGDKSTKTATNNAKYEMRGQARLAVAQQVRLITGNGDRSHRECRDYHYNHSC